MVLKNIFKSKRKGIDCSKPGQRPIPFIANEKVGFIVFYHEDFDGLLSACLFHLRAPEALNINASRLVYLPIRYEQEIELIPICMKAKEQMDVEEVYLIFLDYDPTNTLMKDREKTLCSHWLTVDHHAEPNKFCQIAFHNPFSDSCAEIIDQMFPYAHEDEHEDHVKNAIYAAKIIDTGADKVDWLEFEKVITTPPGCLLIFNINDKLSCEESFSILLRYLTDTMTETDMVTIDQLIDTNKRLLQHTAFPEKQTILFNGMSIGIYLFQEGLAENMLFAITAFKASSGKFYNDLNFIIQKIKGTVYRVSLRTKVSNFDVNSFCKIFGGGGKRRGMGAFTVDLKGWELDTHLERLLSLGELAIIKTLAEEKNIKVGTTDNAEKLS